MKCYIVRVTGGDREGAAGDAGGQEIRPGKAAMSTV